MDGWLLFEIVLAGVGTGDVSALRERFRRGAAAAATAAQPA